jgi:hypothetical protein
MVVVREPPESGSAPYPFYPSERNDPPEASHRILAWAETEAKRLLAPSGNAAYDEARGLLLRLPRAQLTADLLSEAELAESVERELWG